MITARRAGRKAIAAGILAGMLWGAALGLTGCDDGTPAAPPRVVRVLTDASSYVSGSLVRSILLNGSAQPVYTLNCADYATLEIQRPEGWMNLGAWYPLCDGPTVPIALSPGRYRALPDLDSGTEGLEPGTYRIRVEVYGNDTFPYKLIPEDQRLSEPFTIVNGGVAARS